MHDADFVAAIRWLIERDDVDGIVNVASPNPLPNAEFMRVLREAYGAPFGLPAPNWMLAIGAVFMRTETELILKSRRVVPGRLLDYGFQFAFPQWREAARDLCQRLVDRPLMKAGADGVRGGGPGDTAGTGVHRTFDDHRRGRVA